MGFILVHSIREERGTALRRGEVTCSSLHLLSTTDTRCPQCMIYNQSTCDLEEMLLVLWQCLREEREGGKEGGKEE